MSDEGISIDEKRVFEDRRGVAEVFVASGIGLARVAVSDDQIGRFGLVERRAARDVATDRASGQVAVATPEDILVGDGEEFDATEFGLSVAVAFADGFVAATPESRIARYEGGDWSTISDLDGVRAMDGDLVASESGVFRIEGDAVGGIGLDGATDVAAAGPFAATRDGLYRRVDGEWLREADGEATAIASDGDRSVAVVDGTVLERTDDGNWKSMDCPAEDVVDLAVGHATYAVTADGTLLVDPPTAKDGAEGWSSRSLGLTDVGGIAVLETG